MRTPNPLTAVFYARCSTTEQHLSPTAQRQAAEQWASTHGVTIVSAHIDSGVSGASDLADRVGLAEALGALKAHGAGVLLVARLDRVARDVGVFAAVDRAVCGLGARIVSADGSGNGDSAADAFMRNVLAAAAQYELALLKARTRAALGVKRSRLERVGSVRYGYSLGADGVHLETNADEQQVIATARELHAQGLSLRAIAAELESRGMRSRVGKAFAAKQIAEMVRREAGVTVARAA